MTEHWSLQEPAEHAGVKCGSLGAMARVLRPHRTYPYAAETHYPLGLGKQKSQTIYHSNELR